MKSMSVAVHGQQFSYASLSVQGTRFLVFAKYVTGHKVIAVYPDFAAALASFKKDAALAGGDWRTARIVWN